MSAAQMVCPYCLSKTQAGRAACPFCGKSFENHNPPEALPFGTVLGDRYTLAQHLNTDGEGILYAAVENSAGLRVTIKEYLPVTLSQGRNEAGEVEPKSGSEVLFKTTRMDFADLYRAIQRITPATGLVAVLDVLEENQTVYAVTEQIQGTPLSEYLSLRASVLPLAEARSLMQPIMEGVAALHKAGLVHRGVCPENILLTEGGVARLCGYATLGLRRAGSELKPQLYDGYSAPEQYKPQEFEGRYTDVYGLAAVFYRLVTGAQPLSAVQRQVRDSLPPASRAESGVPGYVSSILSAAMRLVPAERIQTVPELMGALASPTAADALMGREKKEPSLTLNTRHLLALAAPPKASPSSGSANRAPQPYMGSRKPARAKKKKTRAPASPRRLRLPSRISWACPTNRCRTTPSTRRSSSLRWRKITVPSMKRARSWSRARRPVRWSPMINR